jgi:hypothetical protein
VGRKKKESAPKCPAWVSASCATQTCCWCDKPYVSAISFTRKHLRYSTCRACEEHEQNLVDYAHQVFDMPDEALVEAPPLNRQLQAEVLYGR